MKQKKSLQETRPLGPALLTRVCCSIHRHRDAAGAGVRHREHGEPAKTCARRTCRFYLCRLPRATTRRDGNVCCYAGSAGHGVCGLGSGVGRAVVRWATLWSAARFPRLLPGRSASALPPPRRCECPHRPAEALISHSHTHTHRGTRMDAFNHTHTRLAAEFRV